MHDGIVVDRGKGTGATTAAAATTSAIYSPPDNHSFVYMHMLKPSPVQLGDHVHAGEVVGQLGCTGSCDGPHLHFEVRIGKASLGAGHQGDRPAAVPEALAAADAGLAATGPPCCERGAKPRAVTGGRPIVAAILWRSRIAT